MSKISKEQLSDFINDLLDSLEEDQLDTQNESESNRECEFTPIELLISNFVNKCIDNDTLPTLEEAQTIAILDQINYRYNH